MNPFPATQPKGAAGTVIVRAGGVSAGIIVAPGPDMIVSDPHSALPASGLLTNSPRFEVKRPTNGTCIKALAALAASSIPTQPNDASLELMRLIGAF
jgi:hypothetical protein